MRTGDYGRTIRFQTASRLRVNWETMLHLLLYQESSVFCRHTIDSFRHEKFLNDEIARIGITIIQTQRKRNLLACYIDMVSRLLLLVFCVQEKPYERKRWGRIQWGLNHLLAMMKIYLSTPRYAPLAYRYHDISAYVRVRFAQGCGLTGNCN